MRFLEGKEARIDTLAFSPGGCYLAAGGRITCRVWDLRRPQAKPVEFAATTRTRPPLFLSETVVAVRSLWDWVRHDVADRSWAALAPGVQVSLSVALDAANGRLKALAGYNSGQPDRHVVLTFRLTADSAEPVSAVTVPAVFSPVQYAPAGDRYHAADFESHYLHAAATDERLTAFEFAREGNDAAFEAGLAWRFAPDGRRLYAPARARLLAFDCDKGGPPAAKAELAAGSAVRSLAPHPGGRVVATVESAPPVQFRDAETLAVTRSYDFGLPKPTAVAFSPDGTLCAVANSKGKVLLFDVDE